MRKLLIGTKVKFKRSPKDDTYSTHPNTYSGVIRGNNGYPTSYYAVLDGETMRKYPELKQDESEWLVDCDSVIVEQYDKYERAMRIV
jgi:hypothetical protein